MIDDRLHRESMETDEALSRWLRRFGDQPHLGSLVFLGRVVRVPAVLNGQGRYVLVEPCILEGTPEEGALGTVQVRSTEHRLVYLLGTYPPRIGDYLDCRFIDYRWTAQYSGGSQSSSGILVGCQCNSAPATLRMTVVPANCGAGLLNSCTISYRTTPAELNSLQLGASCYLSTELFPDPPTGDYFYYYFSCFSTFMRISQAFPSSVFGSPWLSSAIYTWKLGDPGNLCSPFLLSNGKLTAAGGSSCSVTLTE